MDVFWYAYAVVMLVGLAWVGLSPTRRRRYSAGGRSLAPAVALLSCYGLGGLVNGLLDTTLGTTVTMLLALPFVMVLVARQRRRLAGVPDHELTPHMARWRVQAPTGGDLVRHPWRSTRTSLALVRSALGREGREREKEWERAHGLR